MTALPESTQALAGLVRSRGAALKRYGFLLCGDAAEAEDLVQDALVRAFTFAQRSDVAQAERYVRKVMLNLFLDRTRRRRVWQRLMPLAAVVTKHDPQERSDLRGDLRQALLELTPRQRACVVLHYYLDLSVVEVAEELGVSPGSVKRHLHQARGRLAERLASATSSLEDGYATP